MNKNLLRLTRTAAALAMAGLLAACASGPATTSQLTEAHRAYDSAAADAQVVRSAPLELRKAQEALAKADAAANANDDLSTVDHYAYLARQRTEVAVQAGQIARSDEIVAQAQANRDRIVIDARTREAEAQRDAAIRARSSAEQSRSLAEQRLAAAQAAQQQASVANARASSLEAQLAELQAKKTDRGMVLTLGDVLFDTGRATLRAGAMRTVDQLASFLENNPSQKILVEGHTDNVGSDASNRELSMRRAESVKRALTDRRIASDRVETNGLGEGYPVASNASADGRQRNRRVEVIFADENGVVKARAY